MGQAVPVDLGAVRVAARRAAEAEAMYRADLDRYPANRWSLYGLARALRTQDKGDAATQVERQFAQAWALAEVVLTSSRF